MIHDYRKAALNGRKLSLEHSPSYGVSSDALLELIREHNLIRESDAWKLALDCIDIGVRIGFHMAENDRKKSDSFQIRSTPTLTPNAIDQTETEKTA